MPIILKMKARPNATSMNIDDVTSMFAMVPTIRLPTLSAPSDRGAGANSPAPRSLFYLIHPTAADFTKRMQRRSAFLAALASALLAPL